MLKPPNNALKFLRWFCREDFLDEIEGDLIELFIKESSVNGKKAKWSFFYQVLRHFRPDFIKRIALFSSIYPSVAMIRNYFKIAARSLAKNRFFSMIHIAGLAIGVAACLLIFQYVSFERSYDKFHDQAENIYRVPIRYSEGFSPFSKTAANHPALGPAMKRDFPEVEDFTRIMDPINMGRKTALSYLNETGQRSTFIEEKTFIADSSFFTIFSFPFVSGSPTNALKKPNSIVLTSSMAIKYFGNEDPLHKTMNLGGSTGHPLKVTGVIEDIPENSHLQFDALMSFQTYLGSDFADNSWVWPEFYTYVLLKPGTNSAALQAKFPALTERYMAEIHKEHNFKTYFSLQPLLDIHLHSDCANEPTNPGSNRMVQFLSILGIFILIIAWVNYINLSTSRSIERAKEVGVRKVVGARRSQLMGQFFSEAILLNALSISLGFVIAKLSLTSFSQVVGKNIGDSLLNYQLFLNPVFWVVFSGCIIISGLIVGVYPALVLSKFRPVQVLRGRFHRGTQGVLLRKLLVGFQFVLSVLLIAATILVTRQISFMNKQELGYAKEQILVSRVPTYSDSISYVRNQVLAMELAQLPEVQSMTRSSEIPGKLIALRSESRPKGLDKEYNTSVFLKRVDHEYLSTFDIPIVAGRDFRQADSSRIYGAQNNKVLINRVLAESYGFKDPEDAIGKNIWFKLGQNEHLATVVGVVENYHQRSLKEAYDPLLYYFPLWDDWTFYSFKLSSTDWNKSVAAIERIYRKVVPDHTLDYFFLDEFFDRQYRAEQQFSKVCKLMAALAIFVACLGFFGLSALLLSQRTKEIGVRKILGATMVNIMHIVSKDFVYLLIVANVIALPIVVYLGGKWLDNFAFNNGIGWQPLLLPALFLLSIVIGIVLFQIRRSAVLNPIHALRDE